MTDCVARESLPLDGFDDHVPLSLVRVRSKPARRLQVEPRGDAFRSTLADPTMLPRPRDTRLPENLDALLQEGFSEAIAETGAQVGLLHRRGDAFLYTTGVHGLDRGMHMMVWVSMWDAAVQVMLRGHTLVGPSQESAENATVARRLGGTIDPASIIAVPVMVGATVEAVVELGRFGRWFPPGADLFTLEAMQGALEPTERVG
jgi:hypothetical protein